MAQTHKKLAQSAPAAATPTTVYTVPGVTTTLVYGIVVANTSGTPLTFQIFCVPSAGSSGVTNAIYYNVTIPGNDTFVANISVDMATGDFIVVESNNGNATFTISGMEIT